MQTNERVYDDAGFNDLLYDWMARAPWIGISAAAHLVVFLVLMAIPWGLLREEASVEIAASLEPTPIEEFVEPEPELDEPIEQEVIEEPVLQDADIEEDAVSEDDSPWDAESLDMSPTDVSLNDAQFNEIIGIGGGASGPRGNRFGPGRGRGGGEGTERALKAGLEWLVHHQSRDGSWDGDGFTSECGKLGSSPCEGAGEAGHDVGLTGLALLALMGNDNSTRRGPYRSAVARGVRWLRDQQDADTGQFGSWGPHGMYDHAIASLAMCEAYYFSRNPMIRRSAQKAVDFICAARNPHAAWRYDATPTGENDTSVTGWMVFALKSAEEGGLDFDPEAFTGALSWFDEVTDPGSGRTGYDTIGSASSRRPHNEHFPTDKGEAMSAVSLLCRFFLGHEPASHPVMEKQAQLLLQRLPEWDPDGLGNDIYYWYYGSYAMYQMGGSKYWRPWNDSLKRAVLESQRQDGDARGSWDPKCAWGHSGGRVYSTALMVLCLEVYFRYTRILGAR